jgi:hypothetical protein
MLKQCMICLLLKPIRFDFDSIKSKNENQIHQYNYSCYKCLNLRKKFIAI